MRTLDSTRGPESICPGPRASLASLAAGMGNPAAKTRAVSSGWRECACLMIRVHHCDPLEAITITMHVHTFSVVRVKLDQWMPTFVCQWAQPQPSRFALVASMAPREAQVRCRGSASDNRLQQACQLGTKWMGVSPARRESGVCSSLRWTQAMYLPGRGVSETGIEGDATSRRGVSPKASDRKNVQAHGRSAVVRSSEPQRHGGVTSVSLQQFLSLTAPGAGDPPSANSRLGRGSKLGGDRGAQTGRRLLRASDVAGLETVRRRRAPTSCGKSGDNAHHYSDGEPGGGEVRQPVRSV